MSMTDSGASSAVVAIRSGFPLAVILLALAVAPARAQGPHPQQERLRDHVETLASAEFGGRRGPGARKAEAFLVDHFRALGLEPLFGPSYTQDIPGKAPGEIVGRNVGAKLAGADPAHAGEWIIVSAHYDHLGQQGGKLYPGADDNASGVAMLLEVARCLAGSPERPRRGILFVGFDLEEDGLWGSRHFVGEPPVPIESIKLFLTADLIGGALGGVCQRDLFVMGTEHEPALRSIVRRAAVGLPLRVDVMGSDLLLIDRSDYGPFRARQVPYIFFSTGETPRYHTPEDTADRVDYPKLLSVSRLIERVVRETAEARSLPAWTASSEATIDEAAAVRGVLQTLRENREGLRLTPAQARTLDSTLESLDAILARGAITPRERGWMVRMAQWILATML